MQVRRRCVSSSILMQTPRASTTESKLVYAVGLTDNDFAKPQIGISPVWWEGMHVIDR